MDFVKKLLETDFMPHGHCYFWRPDVLWPNVIGDLFTALAYYLIPFLLVNFLRKRPDINFPGIFAAFAAFILACGTTHVLAIVSVWHPVYRVEGVVKLGTAFISLSTVGLLVRNFPAIISIPTGRQLLESNHRLQEEILERRRTESELRQSEKRFRMLMQNAPIGMGLLNLQGEWLEVNRALVAMLGYSEEELLSRNFQSITHPADLGQDEIYMEQLLNQNPSQLQFEKRYICKNGEELWCMIAVAVISNEQDQPSYMVAQIVDISDQKNRQRKLKKLNAVLEQKVAERTQKLQESNQDMENFIYAITHDLRLPLNNLKGLTLALEEDLGKLLNEHPQHQLALSLIGENAQRMDQLIFDLLLFSRAGRQDFQKTRLNMNELVQEVLQMIRNGNPDQPMEIDLQHLPDAYGDRSAIRQVWQNLLDNAFKYSAREALPRLSIRGWQDDKGQVVFQVDDNGVGFDETFKNKLFNLFQRLHKSEDFPGTGVGLATCHRILAKHGGRIWAQSPGKGASFFFSLPVE